MVENERSMMKIFKYRILPQKAGRDDVPQSTSVLSEQRAGGAGGEEETQKRRRDGRRLPRYFTTETHCMLSFHNSAGIYSDIWVRSSLNPVSGKSLFYGMADRRVFMLGSRSLLLNKRRLASRRSFERGTIIGLRKGEFSYNAIGARVLRNSSTVMQAWKQWTDKHRKARKTDSGRRKVTIPSRQTIDVCVCNELMSKKPGKLIGTKWSFQMNNAPICGTMMAAFVSDAMPVNAAFQSALSNDIGALHPELWFGPELVLFFQGINGAIFQQDSTRPHVVKTVRDFCAAHHMQLLPWGAYSPDMSPIEQVWDLVGRRLARDLRPAASKDELLLRIQAIRNSLPQAYIQNLFGSMPRRIATLIAARGGYTKY
ncbi:transposable element Tcb2 transposase [Trichonephila clavipes]|nr:transposable element Tcb2 transposase [Trichonephila clavipes]